MRMRSGPVQARRVNRRKRNLSVVEVPPVRVSKMHKISKGGILSH